MKLIGSFVAAALAADWPGQSETDPCGSTLKYEGSSVNATCVMDFGGFAPWRVFLGGQYITGMYSFTNYDGQEAEVDPSVDVLVFWEEALGADGELDNSTCGTTADITVTCTPYGAAVPGVYFQETANDYRMAKGSNYNVQIGGAVAGDVLAIALKDAYGNAFGAQNLSTNSGEITVDGINVVEDAWGNLYTDTGMVSLTVGDQAAEIVNLFTTQQPGANWEPSFWHSSVSN